MRKFMFVSLFALCLCLMLTGCGDGADDSSYADVILQGGSPGALVQSKEQTENAESEEVDIDLTKLSETMVLAELTNMNTTPLNYEGKRIKIKGTHYMNVLENGDVFDFVGVLDSTGCCPIAVLFSSDDAQGLDEGVSIEVCGVYEVCTDENGSYFCLKADYVKEL